jgi:hypothetical protein
MFIHMYLNFASFGSVFSSCISLCSTMCSKDRIEWWGTVYDDPVDWLGSVIIIKYVRSRRSFLVDELHPWRQWTLRNLTSVDVGTRGEGWAYKY